VKFIATKKGMTTKFSSLSFVKFLVRDARSGVRDPGFFLSRFFIWLKIFCCELLPGLALSQYHDSYPSAKAEREGG
jgi:hypothetical protein